MKIYAIQKVMRFSKHNEYGDPIACFTSRKAAKEWAEEHGYDVTSAFFSNYSIRAKEVIA